MNAVTNLKPRAAAARATGSRVVAKQFLARDEAVVVIMSDSGEGAQQCGQSFGAIAARIFGENANNSVATSSSHGTSGRNPSSPIPSSISAPAAPPTTAMSATLRICMR